MGKRPKIPKIAKPSVRRSSGMMSEAKAKYGVHILGEGGEYETLVTNGPHMNREIKVEYDVFWRGNWGEIKVKNAWLG